MSTRVVFVWLAVAIILGGIAIYLLQSGSPRSANGEAIAVGDRVVEFLPQDVTQIEFKAPDRTRELITRDAATGGWKITLERSQPIRVPTAQPGIDWPVLDTRVQAFLQKLLETKSLSTPPKDAAITGGAGGGSAGPSVIRIFLSGASNPASGPGAGQGGVIQINLADRTLGGTGLIEVIRTGSAEAGASTAGPGRLAIVDDWLHRVCQTPGPRAWRDPTALALAKSDVSRIRLESAAPGGLRALELGRIGGRWSVREPIAAPANRESVTQLLATLSDLSIADFLDNGAANADTRLDQPVAKIRLEYDRRTSSDTGNNVDTVANTLAVGGPAGMSGSPGGASADKLYAQIDNDRVVTIDAKPLATLPFDPGHYVWPHPSAASATDLGTIVLELRTSDGASVGGTNEQSVYRRSADRWSRLNADGSEGVLIDAGQKDVESLAGFLTGSAAKPTAGGAGAGSGGATSIAITPPPRFVQFGRISLLSLGSMELESIDVGETGPGLVTFRTGPVYRMYAQDKVPGLIVDLRAKARAAGVPVGLPVETAPSNSPEMVK